MNDASDRDGSGSEQPRVSLFGRRAKLRSPSESLQPQAAPPPPAPPAPKRRHEGLARLSGLLSFVLIGAFLGVGGFAWAMRETTKPGPLTADKVVVIGRDDESEGGSIPEQLARAGVIDSPLVFNLAVLVDGNRPKLRHGEFLFKQNASLRDVEDILVFGKMVLHKVTVPEGLTSDQVVQRLRGNDVFAGDIKEIPREGSILPETYEFERGVSRAKVLAVMEQAQAKVVDEIWKKRAPDLPIKSPGELVTLASIVEKETGRADERPHVAGVFINRLQKRMKLESDPTIVYGLVGGKGTLGHPISKSELIQPTPYNTYIIPGLPPGPITNPGKAALEAVANPSPTKDLYFVADGTGGHAFADTLEQHQKNVQHWREIEKDAKDRLAPDAVPTAPAPGAPAPKVHGALDKVAPKAFGGLTAPVVAKPPPASASFAKRLARLWRRSADARGAARTERRALGARRRQESRGDGGCRAGGQRRVAGRSERRRRQFRADIRSGFFLSLVGGGAGRSAKPRGAIWRPRRRGQARRRQPRGERRDSGGGGASCRGTAARLRRLRRHAARSPAQHHLRPELSQGGSHTEVTRVGQGDARVTS